MPQPVRSNEPAARASTRALPGLQVLRALAALLVVLHHAELNVLSGFGFGREPLFNVASSGVDIFFVISGFIMLVSSRRLFAAPGGSATFMARRLIRIVPLYWAITTVYVAGYALAPAALGRTVSLGTIVASYFFWPFIGIDGQYHPVLVVGWTLNYEMFFYALFAIAIFLPRPWAVAFVTGALAFTIVLASFLGGSSPPLAFWGQPIVLEFAAGIALALAYERRRFVPRPVAALAACAALAALACQIGQPIPGGWPRLVAYGLPALVLVGGVALASPSGRDSRLPRAAIFLGDASYSLYLVHLMTLTIVRVAAIRLGLVPRTATEAALFVIASIAASVAIAIASYALFERPVTRLLRRGLEAKKPAAA